MPEPTSQTATENHSSASSIRSKITTIVIEYGKTILITFAAAIFLKIFVIEAYRIPSASMEQTLSIGDFLFVNKLSYGLRTPLHIPFTNIRIPSLVIPLCAHLHHGDVVVFEFPGAKDQTNTSEPINYIKRCVGLPGDTIEIRLGHVFVNKKELHFPPTIIRTSHPTGEQWKSPADLFPDGSNFTDVNYGPLIVPKRGSIVALNPANYALWHLVIQREGHTIELDTNSVLIDGKPESTYTIQKDYYFVLGDNRDNSLDSRFWGFVPDNLLIGEALVIYWSWDTEMPVHNFSDKLHTIRWKRIGTIIR